MQFESLLLDIDCAIALFEMEEIISPHFGQTYALCSSEQISNLSTRIELTPYEIRESLSISPNLIPPCLFLPLTGCLVNASIGPVALT
uniref:Uncharacterized protein n=1 Tax=Cryptosporidium parvum TaxID=5807 RepID=F0X5H3_CRYPV